MAGEETEFRVEPAAAEEEDGPGAVAAFPFDRMVVERFREAFPGARWRDAVGAWFVPGVRAERRLAEWVGREWSGVLAFADERGRDAFAFEPVQSPYLEAGAELVVRTPYSREVIAALRDVPWARWDRGAKAWMVPYRSWEELRTRWKAIEEAAAAAEPAARRARAEARKGTREEAERRDATAEKRRRRHPVPGGEPPPLERVLATEGGCVVFEAVEGEIAGEEAVARFHPGIRATEGDTLVWATWRRPSHDELVRAWPAREEPGAAARERGWWAPTLAVLREERRKAASIERARETRMEARMEAGHGADGCAGSGSKAEGER